MTEVRKVNAAERHFRAARAERWAAYVRADRAAKGCGV
jgi:hypothetical protein